MQSGVHRSLVSADNALVLQSERHPDGWGVAYYVAGAPHVVKSAAAAVSDHLFRHVSGVVTSETVLAHIRKATQGDLSTINTHPFQYGTWVFAHNGNIKGFAAVRDALDADRFVATRITTGSVGPAEVDRMLAEAEAERQAMAGWLAAERGRLAAAERALAAAVAAIRGDAG